MNKNKAPQHSPYEWGEQSFTDTSDHTPGYNGSVHTDTVTDEYGQQYTVESLKTGAEPLISHPNVTLTTTEGKPAIDPLGEFVSPRELAMTDTPLAGFYGKDADPARIADAVNTKLYQNAEEIDRTIDAVREVEAKSTEVQNAQETARFWRKGKLAREALNLAGDEAYLPSRINWLVGNDFQKDAPLDTAQAVARHDEITKTRLNEKLADGETVMDHLHEQATTMDQQRTEELGQKAG